MCIKLLLDLVTVVLNKLIRKIKAIFLFPFPRHKYKKPFSYMEGYAQQWNVTG